MKIINNDKLPSGVSARLVSWATETMDENQYPQFKMEIDISSNYTERFEYSGGWQAFITDEGRKKILEKAKNPADHIFWAASKNRILTNYYDRQEFMSFVALYSEIDILTVFCCLFSDSQAGEEIFQDFCDNYGYSSDSIAAFKMHQTCQETTLKLRRILTLEQRDAIAKLVENY